jgi:hypothetical protein
MYYIHSTYYARRVGLGRDSSHPLFMPSSIWIWFSGRTIKTKYEVSQYIRPRRRVVSQPSTSHSSLVSTGWKGQEVATIFPMSMFHVHVELDVLPDLRAPRLKHMAPPGQIQCINGQPNHRPLLAWGPPVFSGRHSSTCIHRTYLMSVSPHSQTDGHTDRFFCSMTTTQPITSRRKESASPSIIPSIIPSINQNPNLVPGGGTAIALCG